MGARKKPMELRELHGTSHRNKQRNNNNAPIKTGGIGSPPSHLLPEQVKIWDEVVSNMYAEVLGEGDKMAFEMLVRLIHEMRTNFSDMPGAKLSQLNSLLSKFGMTPSDRTKIVVPKKDKKNPFEGI